jgi:hypothetical protein
LTIRGYFGGTFGGFTGLGGSSFDNFGTLTNTFVGPTTQSLKLGSNLYTVTLGPVVLPDPIVNSNLGSISATIAAQPANATPEPSSLVLACLGLPSLGLARWFRRRKIVDRNARNA